MGSIGASKLNEEKVVIIKDLLNTGDFTHQQIADFFEVSRELITHIKNGRRWNEETKSFRMKTSNDFRQFTEPKYTRDKLKVKNITITLEDGRELDLR